jgi:hypothetical protein
MSSSAIAGKDIMKIIAPIKLAMQVFIIHTLGSEDDR